MDVVHATRQVCCPAEKTAGKKTTRLKKCCVTFMQTRDMYLHFTRSNVSANGNRLGLWLRLECSLDSLSIDSAHVIYVSEGYDVAYNRRTASQPSHVVLRVTWYVKTFQKRKLRVLNPARINVFYWFNWLNLIGS